MPPLTHGDARAAALGRAEALIGRPVVEVDTPAVVVDLDVLERNIAAMQALADAQGVDLRPHAKTHKSARVGRMQLDAGAAGLTVARLGEAEMLAGAGVADLLVHYPVVGQGKVARLAALTRLADVTVALDSVDVARPISEALVRAGRMVDVLVEIDAGMERTGTASVAGALEVARAVDRLPGLQLVGVSFYPGHLGHDRSGVLAAAERAAAVREALLADGLACTRVSGGSTPTRDLWQGTCLTELRCGSYVFLDRSEAALAGTDGDFGACALTVDATVVSTSPGGRVVVDAGSKTLSSDVFRAGSRTGFGAVLGAPAVDVVRLSEEHGVLDWSRAADRPAVGDRVTLVPNHVCVVVNLSDFLVGVRHGVVTEIVTVDARGNV